MSDAAVPPPMDPATLAALEELNKTYQVYFLAAFWVEAVVYGIYLSLFISAIRIMTKKRSLDHFASRVFLSGIIIMFILISIHNASIIYKMIRAYALFIGTPPNLPVVYFQDFIKWDNFAHPVILALLTWLGDYLVIYRCFLIWRRNYYVILLPAFLLLVSLGTTSVNLYWFQHPDSIPFDTMTHFLNVIFPVNLIQNILTTGLIAFKVWKQHRETRASGLMLGSNIDLITVLRIVVESALIYTVEMFVMIIMFYRAHPGLVIVQHLLTPSIGIVFVLIAVRAHVAKSESVARNAYPSNSMYPSWMSGDREEGGRRPPMPIITTVTEQHHLEDMSPTKLRTELSDSYRKSAMFSRY
ncbi:hypothetical protein FA15DRAFT_685307 [Coprinopsis marcescibilis]|uniref:Uncharacterized protein n=1 Tax=Coprinopsis marcescibilis TaxID=230819 RepID=A0A5C3L676_COPMA|nr:hypothetical protein FA15DRAFT_685307 [Coprinopsis marcescibilis]